MANEENANKMFLSSKFYYQTRTLVSPGWFIIQRHNNIRNAIASMMRDDLKVEPALIDATIESADLPVSAIKRNEGRVVMDFGCDFKEHSLTPRFQTLWFRVITKNPLQLH